MGQSWEESRSVTSHPFLSLLPWTRCVCKTGIEGYPVNADDGELDREGADGNSTGLGAAQFLESCLLESLGKGQLSWSPLCPLPWP